MAWAAFGKAVVLIAAALSGAAVGAGERAASRPAGKPTTRPARAAFSLATYNINFGNPNLKLVAATIRKADADFVCVQETNAESRRYLTARLKQVYPHMRYRDGRAAEGFAFLSKTPIAEVKFTPPKFGWFGTWFCRVRLGGRDVQIANVHLRPMIPARGAKTMDLLLAVLATDRIRLREQSAIFGALAKDSPVIVAGDFNAPPALPSAGFLPRRGYTDSFAAVNKDAEKAFTWHWKWRGTHWRYRLDYIFHSAHVKTLTSRIIPADASDHYLVVSSFAWAPKGKAKPPETPKPPKAD